MRILFCNKYNYPFSGTEVYLFELMELLRSHGHQVALFSMADPRGEPTGYDHHFVPHIEFKSQHGLLVQARNAAHAIYSRTARKKVRAMVHEFQPDLAHVRNIYHHLSPSILWELKEQQVPVIYHVNDFKLLCPSYNLVSRGEPCEECKGGQFWHALRTRCYPGMGARFTLMTEAYVHKWLHTYVECVDQFIAPSRFVKDKFVAHGWEESKFEVLPHFQKFPSLAQVPVESPLLLYFGRLSPEKGVADLLYAMARVPQVRLVVAGDGPQRPKLEMLALQLGLINVEFAGHLCGAELDSLIARSLATVLPSHAYETFGKTILESYAHARPVIATDTGSRRELVEEAVTGVLYPVGDVGRLAELIALLASHPETADAMGRNGRALAEERYGAESHYQAMAHLYSEVLARKTKTLHILPPALEPASKKLRVAFIGGRGVISKYSGIESYYEEVGKRLAERGHEVIAYCRTYFTPDQPEHNGMRLVRIPTVRSKHLETWIHTLLSTAHVMMHGCDIVHYHALGPALFSFLPRLVGMKTMVTVQGLDWQRQKWGRLAAAVLRCGEWASVHFPSKTAVVSQTLQRRYRQSHRSDPIYLPNGGLIRQRRAADTILDWGLKPENYILFLGRFSPEKGCHLLVHAYEQLGTEVDLVMAGAASYCDEYSRELRTHASDRVKMLDWVSGDTLDELLTNAMIFVLPSDMEGLSLALLDAMGAGLCVVASDIPENREAVDGAGFTFRRGDAADLTGVLRSLIENSRMREAAGRAARQKILEYYDWDKIAEGIEAAYFDVLGRPRAQVPPKKPSVGSGVMAKKEVVSSRRAV